MQRSVIVRVIVIVIALLPKIFENTIGTEVITVIVIVLFTQKKEK